MENANTLYSEKKYDDARQEFEHAIEIDKGLLSAWRGLGWSHWALGEKDRAYQIWNDLIKVFPENLPTLLALSKASEKDQRLNDASNYYAQILKLLPDNSSAHQGRARIFIVQHKFQLAEQELRSVLSSAPSNKNAKSMLVDALMGQGRYREVEDIVQAITRAKPVPNNLRRLAETLAKLGKYEQAADAYRTSLGIQDDKDILSAWRGLGVSLRKIGQNERAHAIWREILQVFPFDLPTLLTIGRTSERDKLWQQGLNYYSQVLTIVPGNNVAHLGRAKIFSAQKNYKSAELELKSILSRLPSNIEAGTALVEVLVAMDRRGEAIQILRPIVDLDPVPKKLNRLGTILADDNRDEEAVTYFRKSLQLEPDNSTAVVGIAHAYWNQHNYFESIKLLRGYLAKHPDNDIVRIRLAEHASAAENLELAEPEWKFLANKYPEEVKWKLKLAKLLHKTGQHEEALTISNAVITKDPNNKDALSILSNNAIFAGDIQNAIFWTNRLTSVAPTLDQLVRLGRLHMQLGENLDIEGKHEAAIIQYGAALQALRHADKLDPIKSMASVDIIKALLLMGKQKEAIELGQQTYIKHPNSADVIKHLSSAFREQGDYSDASEMLAHNSLFFPNSSSLKQRLADLTYHAGKKEHAFNMLNDFIEDSGRQVIPVLLYHGISLSDRQDTVALKNFRNQLLALKQDGYHSITITQLLGFFEDNVALPAKPILITFDDARADSFKYADPVLKEIGFQATMFVPVSDIATHQPYAAVWPTVKKMFENGRWDMQCHGSRAQHWIPVNSEGHLGHFLANRMWLVEAARLESDKEYGTRIQEDMLTCKETMTRILHGVQISAFAFPYGDQGHRSLSNAPEAFNINQRIVKSQFSFAFNVDNSYLATEKTPRFALPRFEVPRTYSGKDLVHQLKVIDPKLSVYYKLAHLSVQSGRYKQALEINERLANEGLIDEVELQTTSGKILNWSGDHAGARMWLTKAIAHRPNDSVIQKQIDALDRRLDPAMRMSGLYFQDNADRTYYSFGPSVQYGVSDRLSLTAYYKYLDFDQKLDQGSIGTVIGQQSYQANGNQFEGQFNYELAARSMLSLSAGFAAFSGQGSPTQSKSDSIFPLGAIKLTAGVGDRLDLSLAADHTYVNTAGAIVNDIALSRVQGKFKLKLLDSLSLSASNAYLYYTGDNRRNRTEIDLDSYVWNDPDITVGAQFTRDNIQKNNPLFWSPNNYLAFSTPVSLKKKWGQSLVTKFAVSPGMGKETGNDFKFQINGSASLNWELRDDLSMSLSVNRYQAATYSSFSAFFGVFVRF